MDQGEVTDFIRGCCQRFPETRGCLFIVRVVETGQLIKIYSEKEARKATPPFPWFQRPPGELQ